jgi:glycogen synthase
MKIRKLIITGDGLFLRRFQPLVEELSLQVDQVACLAGDRPFTLPVLNQAYKVLNKLIYMLSPVNAGKRHKNERAFIAKSKQIEQRIRQLPEKPDLVLHLFSMYCPFWEQFDIPYAMYLDYTMHLVYKNWAPWAPFANLDEFEAWVVCERLAYTRAKHLFALSSLVKTSLVQDYGIDPEKITVVGSFANRHSAYAGEKSFGSKQILFNGAEFERKGGDLVLAAFAAVRNVIPDARLVVIGQKLPIQQDGVENPGRIGSAAEMQKLLLDSDLVVAPGRCDPFPSFVIEAMNYGVPCIVSGNDGMPEIVDHGMNGLVVDPATPELIAASIIDLIDDNSKLQFMSQNARQKVRNQLNCQSVAEKMLGSLSK